MGNLMTPVALLRQSPKGSLVVWDLSCLEVEGDRKKTNTLYQKVSEDHTKENPTNNPYNSCMVDLSPFAKQISTKCRKSSPLWAKTNFS